MLDLTINQHKGINYDKTYAPVARLEAIKIVFAFSTYINFIVYQMDVKSAFLNDKLGEEVYVKQPPGFESSEFPNHVCKSDKTLYGLKQAPKAWKSTSGAYQFLGGKLMCWSAKKQQSVAMSSADAEYVVTARCYANTLWMKSQLTDYDIIYERYHILKRDIELHFIPTQYQLADIFTKPLDEQTFKRLIVELEPFTRSPNMYKEYLVEFWYSAKALENSKISFSILTGGIFREVGVNTFRNAIGAHYLPHSSEYVAPPSIDIVRSWFKTIGYRETVPAKGTLKKSLLPPSLANEINIDYASIFWEDIIIKLNKKQREKVALKPNQPQGPLFIDHMLAICSAAKPMVFKAPKPSSNAERVSQGTKSGAQPRHKKHSNSSKQPSVSSQEAKKGGSSKAPTGSKTSHLKRKKDSSLTMESNPSQTSASTPVVTEMHKEDQQATGGPNSLGVTSEERADPWLSSGMLAFNLNKPIYSTSFIINSESASGYDASANSTDEADPEKSAPSDFIPQQQGMNKGTKNTSYDHLFAGTDSHVLANQTQSVSEGLETVLTQSTTDKGDNNIAKQIEEVESSRTIKLEDLAKLVQNVQPSFKDLDSLEDDHITVVDDSDEDEEADKDGLHATSNIETKDTLIPKSSSPRAKETIAELKTLQWELPAEFLFVPTQVETVKAKLKTVDALPSLLNKVTNALNQFAHAIASKKTKDASVPSAGQAGTQPAEGEKNTNQTTISYSFQSEREHTKKDKGKKAMSSEEIEKESTNSGKHIHLTEEEINHQKKIEEDAKAEAAKCESECDKMLNRKAESRITNCDVLTKKGPITLKVYKEDGTSEVILNFKASDMHLDEWREVINACPNRTGKGWKIIYDQIRSRMDYIHTIKEELGITLDIPLSKQDPLDKLNDLATKKRKHADDIHDYFKANKRLKSSVQYKDHFAGIVLNEHVLDMIIHHQGTGLDDHARTFSALLLAETDKSNLNPLKQMRTTEQLRQ
ncbi:retrovirus-related pol polyprotein from transposon TNT 1-94 [Tanacetum coccineum]